MDCYTNQDLNPRTCRFSIKCKPGYERNEQFRCRKTIKKLIPPPKAPSSSLSISPPPKSPPPKVPSPSDYTIPQPIPAPTQIEPIIDNIQDTLNQLSKVGKEKGAVHYAGYLSTGTFAYVSVINKFKGECIPVFKHNDELMIELTINSTKQKTRILNNNDIMKKFGQSLKKCIDNNVPIICIFLIIEFGNKINKHANLLIYRPFERTMERFEPQGEIYHNSMKADLSINKQLKELFEVKLNQYTSGKVRFIPPNHICPYKKGFQALEGEIKGMNIEGGGFCMMWSLFVMEMILNNPTKTTKDIIEKVMDLTKEDPQFLKDTIRGYVVGVEQLLESTLSFVNKSGFSFEKAPFINTKDKLIQEFVLNIMFETDQDLRDKIDYKSLPKSIEKDIREKLMNLTKDKLTQIIQKMSGEKLRFKTNVTKEQMVTYMLNTYSDIDTYLSPSIKTMNESVSKEPDTMKRVFPQNSRDVIEGDKTYIVFEDSGTGIMLADTLYKDGIMTTLNKPLSKTYSQPPNGWYLSEKYDGLRGIWTGKELVARPSKKDGLLKGKVFSYVPKWFMNMLPPGISLDGEIWMGRGRFQEVSGLSNLKHGNNLDEKWKEVKFMVFDIPHSKKPYVERMKELKTIIDDINIKQGKDCPIQLSNYTIINNNLTELYSEYTFNGAEGIILREPNSLYETKRSKLLLKMKLSDDAEAIVTGYIMGTGKYQGLLGSLMCTLNGKKFNIGTGFNDIMRKEYNDPTSEYYIPIGSTVNFGYMELTKDGIPRHPVFRGIRTDI